MLHYAFWFLKILNDKPNETGINNCNYRKKDTCPLPNSCQTKRIIYQANFDCDIVYIAFFPLFHLYLKPFFIFNMLLQLPLKFFRKFVSSMVNWNCNWSLAAPAIPANNWNCDWSLAGPAMSMKFVTAFSKNHPSMWKKMKRITTLGCLMDRGLTTMCSIFSYSNTSCRVLKVRTKYFCKVAAVKDSQGYNASTFQKIFIINISMC